MKFFENTVSSGSLWKGRFLSSCGRVKTELFLNTDVTASIYLPSTQAPGSLGITRVVCLPVFEFRTSHCCRVDGDFFHTNE